MARPTKLTTQVEKGILAALRMGATRTAAAETNGLPRETLSRWISSNVTFRHAVTRAEANAEIRATSTIHRAYTDGDWRAAFAWLERRRRDEWGRRDRLEIVATVRELAREHGLSQEEEAEAVAEALRLFREDAHGGR